MPKLSSMPWWTGADAAELDVLVYEFVRAAFAHRAGAPTAHPGEQATGARH
jgi:hypothetical protein